MKTILFPTDFSIHADNALIYAIKLAEKTNSNLVVFYSTYIPETFPKKDYNKIVEKDEIYKQTMLESLVAELCKKHKLQTPENIIYDAKNASSVVDNILTIAKKYRADMIIVGTHGITGLKKVLFGSTTSGLILKSKIPVLAIPQGYSYAEIQSIVYASDMNDLSKELSTLTPIANAIGAKIEILFLDYWNSGKDKELQFEKVIKKLKLNNTSFIKKRVTIEKTMAQHIKNYMRKHDNSILAMFPEEANFFEKIFFKSITEKISVKLHKPLLSIKKK
jgi:nucleotide-binding universal stress UspA family protein